MSIKEIERQINSHLLFVYNNLHQEDAIIEPSLITEISNHISTLNDYNSITLVINTRGGNLATGYKIIELLKGKYQDFNVIVVERCASTGTFIALAADKLYITPQALISPTEPQMDIFDMNYSNVSVSVIRNFLENHQEHDQAVAKLDPITLGNYYSTISYFKHLCYNTYDKDKAEKIIRFMLEKVNSHQQPLTKKDFKEMGITIDELSDEIRNFIEQEHQKLIQCIHQKTKNYTRHTVVKSNAKTSVFEKRYDQNKNKIAEGYFVIEEDKDMANIPTKNSRVQDIMKEETVTSQPAHEYADAAAHHDSYNDSCYHDNYFDGYDDYGDSSTYHDEYGDSALFGEQKVYSKKFINHNNNWAAPDWK